MPPTRDDIKLAKHIKRNSKQGKSWFFGIGINEYDEFPNLNNAVKDIQDIISLLKDRYTLDEVVTLYNKEATRDNIIKAFDILQNKITSNDNLIIYFSGHGQLYNPVNHRKDGFWIASNGERDNTAKYVRNSTIHWYIYNIKSFHTLLISDACFSGALVVRDGQNDNSLGIHRLINLKSRWVITSGREDERVSDGIPGTNSPFAESILTVLRENNQQLLNVGKLGDEVMKITKSIGDQLPESCPIYGVGHSGGQYIFKLKNKEEFDEEGLLFDQIVTLIQKYLDTEKDNAIKGKFQTFLNELKLDKQRAISRIKGIDQSNVKNIEYYEVKENTVIQELAHTYGIDINEEVIGDLSGIVKSKSLILPLFVTGIFSTLFALPIFLALHYVPYFQIEIYSISYPYFTLVSLLSSSPFGLFFSKKMIVSQYYKEGKIIQVEKISLGWGYGWIFGYGLAFMISKLLTDSLFLSIIIIVFVASITGIIGGVMAYEMIVKKHISK